MKIATQQLDLEVSDAARLAALCKAAAEPLRLDIMRVLSRESFGVQELAKIFAMPQPGMSHHLKVLSLAGLVTTRRQGNSIFYRRALVKASEPFAEWLTALFRAIDSLALSDFYIEKIESIYGERSTQSRMFFAKHAQEFREQQRQLCETSQYRALIDDMMELVSLSSPAAALEVGPGHGELLPSLAARFSRVVAIDNAEEMLVLAKAADGVAGQGIEFITTPLDEFAQSGQTFDLILMNMVLHHMPSPARVFQQLKRLTNQGAYLIVIELCAHDQEWTKASCGDLWLGFSPDEIDEWAQDAGFSQIQSQFLGLKNGFQIQLTLFQMAI